MCRLFITDATKGAVCYTASFVVGKYDAKDRFFGEWTFVMDMKECGLDIWISYSGVKSKNDKKM